MAHQQQQRALRRLLEDLEQRIGAGAVKLVDRIDNGDPPSSLPGRRAEERYRAAHVLDGNLLAQHAFVVGRALEDEKIAVRLRRHPAGHRMIRIDRERRCSVDCRCCRVRMREHKARQAIRERRLADALLADEHEGVRHPSAAIGSKERGLGAGMAEELVGQARRFCFVGRRALLRSRGRIREAERCGRRVEACTHRLPDVLGHHLLRRSGIDDHAAIRLGCREHQIGVAQPVVKVDRLRFETIRAGATAPARCALQPKLGGHVEHKGQVRAVDRQRRPVQAP